MKLFYVYGLAKFERRGTNLFCSSICAQSNSLHAFTVFSIIIQCVKFSFYLIQGPCLRVECVDTALQSCDVTELLLHPAVYK
jgi:hypothetical protein